jgi:hypothetical protein
MYIGANVPCRRDVLSVLKIVQKAVNDYAVACNRAAAPAGAPAAVDAGAAQPTPVDFEAEKEAAESVLVLCVSVLVPHLFHAETQHRKAIAQVIAQVSEQVLSAKVLDTLIHFIGVEVTSTSKKKSFVPPRDKAALFAKVCRKPCAPFWPVSAVHPQQHIHTRSSTRRLQWHFYSASQSTRRCNPSTRLYFTSLTGKR